MPEKVSVFFLNTISYAAVLVSLFAMRLKPIANASNGSKVLRDLKDGFVYAYKFIPIREILILIGLASLMGVPYHVLMPVFAKNVFHGGAYTLGFLVAMSGLGALMGTLYLAGRKSVIGLCRIIALSSIFFGLGIIMFALSKILWISMVIICMAGFSMMVQMAASNTVLQTIVDEDKRGRIMSFYTMSFMGMAPFGSLLAGFLAHKIGAPNTLTLGGVCCVISALLFARKLLLIREKIRPVYIKKGIIPELAAGLDTASKLEALSSD